MLHRRNWSSVLRHMKLANVTGRPEVNITPHRLVPCQLLLSRAVHRMYRMWLSCQCKYADHIERTSLFRYKSTSHVESQLGFANPGILTPAAQMPEAMQLNR